MFSFHESVSSLGMPRSQPPCLGHSRIGAAELWLRESSTALKPLLFVGSGVPMKRLRWVRREFPTSFLWHSARRSETFRLAGVSPSGGHLRILNQAEPERVF